MSSSKLNLFWVLISIQYKVHTDLVGLFRDFLSGSRQKIVVIQTISDPLPISSGMTQGDFVGSLLIIIYINHVPTEIDIHNNIFLFADDTKF